ncbi:MAG: Omp28-related outer membrane protein [Bacteroidia bacterium]
MKKIVPSFILCLLIFSACDYVEDPTQTTVGSGSSTTRVPHRKVLVEEVTGHFCQSCPAGAQILEAAHSVYGDSMIIVAVHTGDFARSVAEAGLPQNAPTGSFTEDFRTPEGNEFGPVFAMGQSAPRCMYNRIGFPAGAHDMSPYDAATILDTLLDRPQSADFIIEHNYNEVTRTLSFSANGNFLTSGGINGDSYSIVAIITEDSLLGWQVNGAQYVQNYVFNHVLRGCVNTPGTLAGTTIHSGSVVAGDTIDYTLPAGYTLSSTINHDHADLVVFVYNTITKEILQAEKVAIKE